jgi:hypothetical protein
MMNEVQALSDQGDCYAGHASFILIQLIMSSGAPLPSALRTSAEFLLKSEPWESEERLEFVAAFRSLLAEYDEDGGTAIHIQADVGITAILDPSSLASRTRRCSVEPVELPGYKMLAFGQQASKESHDALAANVANMADLIANGCPLSDLTPEAVGKLKATMLGDEFELSTHNPNQPCLNLI